MADNANTNAFPNMVFRHEDAVWHAPSLPQMIDALHSALMTNGASNQLPASHNSYVLHLIEAYAKLERQHAKVTDAYQKEAETRKEILEKYEEASKEWEQSEARYKYEIERLTFTYSQATGEDLDLPTRTNSSIEKHNQRLDEIAERIERLDKKRCEDAKRNGEALHELFARIEQDKSSSDDDELVFMPRPFTARSLLDSTTDDSKGKLDRHPRPMLVDNDRDSKMSQKFLKEEKELIQRKRFRRQQHDRKRLRPKGSNQLTNVSLETSSSSNKSSPSSDSNSGEGNPNSSVDSFSPRE